MAALLPRTLAAALLLGCASASIEFGPYPDGSRMTVALAGGDGSAARVTVVPPGASPDFRRYQGFINQSALAPGAEFGLAANTSQWTILSRPGWSLNVSRLQPTVALSLNGVLVSADLEPPRPATGASCDPPGWAGLAPGIGTTVASSGGCLRGFRSLRSNSSGRVTDEHIYGFGQTVTAGLSAVGSTKFIATFSRTLDSGPSHAPSPSYISLAVDRVTNRSLAHGFFLNTHGYSAFDIGHNDSSRLVVSSPDPVYDYFLFSGPTPKAVIGQFAEVVGGRLSLPPRWAMGMKYDPAEAGYNSSFIETVVGQFAARGIRPDRAVLEPAWQGAQYNWDQHKFPDVPAMIKAIAPTQMILWEHPILDQKGPFYTSLAKADCLAHGAPSQLTEPAPSQFSDLTLPRCQQLWKQYQLSHAIASGAMGFKLDEDDVDVDIGFNDSTVFPSGFYGHQFHNIQGYIMQRLYHEMFASLGKRTWLQSRGGYAGSQAYPTNSYSDGYDYATYVRGVVNSGFSGLIWAPEMRHATCGPDHTPKEWADFARRTQLMFLSPQAQYNAWDSHDGTTLWPSGGPGAANCSEQWLAMFQVHYDLRDGLQAYLYSGFEAQSRTGIPLARALVVDSPDERDSWRIDDQFLLGDALMVAPAGMTDPQSTSRRVYFPGTASSWHAWFNSTGNTRYQPKTWAQVPTPVMTAALFVKGGKPVFFFHSSPGEPVSLGVRVWVPPATTPCAALVPDERFEWSGLYDDDGQTMRYAELGEHWRAAAGFAICQDGRLLLRFKVVHSNYEAAREHVVWSLHGIGGAGVSSSVECSDGSELESSHHALLEDGTLQLSASIRGHDCVVQPAPVQYPHAHH